MKHYLATLTKPVEIQCKFESVDVQSGNVFETFNIPFTMSPGPRRFKTAKKRDEWIRLMNSDYGFGTAIKEGVQS